MAKSASAALIPCTGAQRQHPGCLPPGCFFSLRKFCSFSLYVGYSTYPVLGLVPLRHGLCPTLPVQRAHWPALSSRIHPSPLALRACPAQCDKGIQDSRQAFTPPAPAAKALGKAFKVKAGTRIGQHIGHGLDLLR